MWGGLHEIPGTPKSAPRVASGTPSRRGPEAQPWSAGCSPPVCLPPQALREGQRDRPMLPQTETVPAHGPTAVLSAERLKCHPAPPRVPHSSAVRGPRLHPLGPLSRASQMEGVWVGVSHSLRPLWCPGPAASRSPSSSAPPAVCRFPGFGPSASWPRQLIPLATLLLSCGLCGRSTCWQNAGRISLCVSCSRGRVITEL